MNPETPFHCPRLKANFFSEQACRSNLERARAKEAANLWTGHLHHCLECQGKELEDHRQDACATGARAAPGSRGVETEMAGYGMCKHHPRSKAKVNKYGTSTGLCTQCLMDRPRGQGAFAPKGAPVETSRGEDRKPSEAPAFLSELPPNHGELLEKANQVGPEDPAPAKANMDHRQDACATGGPVNPCPHHPHLERHEDKNGRLMGLCVECYREQAKGRLIPGKGMRSGNILLNFPDKHLALREWLSAEAEDNERTLAGQIIFLLKQVYKGAGP